MNSECSKTGVLRRYPELSVVLIGFETFSDVAGCSEVYLRHYESFLKVLRCSLTFWSVVGKSEVFLFVLSVFKKF